VNGITQTKPIGRYIYATGGTHCTLGGTQGASPNYQDLWWRSPAESESGWGLNITHQGDILFATWFTYEAGGSAAAPAKGMWLVMSNGNRTSAGVYTGTLYRTTGPAFSAVPFTPITPSNYTIVGSLTLTFTDANTGTMSTTVNGISQAKPITRLIYSSPTTVCQ
jgi:serine protease